jgi:L-cystine uptake protein TcyP (sodium:dicarboxylate symporter family)
MDSQMSIFYVIPALVIFGVLYNAVVAWLIHHGYDEGYTWALVAVGVAVTLLGVACIDGAAALLSLLAFSAAGLPMALGSWWRHVQARKAGQLAQRAEVLHD